MRYRDYALTALTVLVPMAIMALVLFQASHPIFKGQRAFEPAWDCASDVGETDVCDREPTPRL